jgi:hypothetical protein
MARARDRRAGPKLAHGGANPVLVLKRTGETAPTEAVGCTIDAGQEAESEILA